MSKRPPTIYDTARREEAKRITDEHMKKAEIVEAPVMVPNSGELETKPSEVKKKGTVKKETLYCDEHGKEYKTEQGYNKHIEDKH